MMQMSKAEKHNALNDILTALRQKEKQAYAHGEKETASALAKTAQKLERYIQKQQEHYSKML